MNLSFKSAFQLINGISSDIQKLLEYFNGKVIVSFFKILFALSASVFSNNLALYLKGLKLSSLAISLLKLVAPSFRIKP